MKEQSKKLARATLGFRWDADFARLEGSPDKPRAVFRAKKVLAGLVHDMTGLEDNPFTFPEVQTLLDGITVGGHKVSDEQQVINTAEAWKRLFEIVEAGTFELSKVVFCDLHSRAARGEALAAGAFRTGAVGIGGTEHKPPAAIELDRVFERGLAIIEEITDVYERAFVFFLFGALNQFFWDGNKRTSRLMMAGELLMHGYDISNVPVKKKLEFNQKMIRFYDTKDATEMMEFLRGCVLD
jgi:prophage maintenance system killer protein